MSRRCAKMEQLLLLPSSAIMILFGKKSQTVRKRSIELDERWLYVIGDALNLLDENESDEYKALQKYIRELRGYALSTKCVTHYLSFYYPMNTNAEAIKNCPA